MEWISGNIFIRPNHLTIGQVIGGHCHNFDHTTFVRRGWLLIRGIDPVTKTEIINQCASPEYTEFRNMMEKYEPQNILRPIRFADKIIEGLPRFDIKFIRQGEPVPEGGTEIMYNPKGWHRLIVADWLHELASLADFTIFDCTYSHRTPQGDVVQENTGWVKGYE